MAIKVTYFVIALIMFLFSSILIKDRKNKTRLFLGLTFLSAGIWNVFLLASVSVNSPLLKVWLHEMKYIGVMTLPVHVFLFTLYLTSVGFQLDRKVFLGLYSLTSTGVILLLTNPWHHLLRASIWVEYRNGIGVVFTENTLWFYGLTAYIYILNALSLLLCISIIRQSPEFHRKKYLILLVAIGMPFGVNVFYNGLSLNRGVIDPTPIVMGIATLLLFYVYKMDQTFDLGSVARDQIFEHFNQPIIVTNQLFVVNDLNLAAEAFFKISLEKAYGKKVDHICQGLLNDKLKTNNRVYEVLKSELLLEDGALGGYSFLIQDETEKELYLEKLEFLSFHDALTEVYNKNYLKDFETKLKASILPIGAVYTDMNKLKMINDTFGHEIGDELIVEVVKQFRTLLSQGDFIVRLGGDEFLLVFPKLTDHKRLEHIVDKIKAIEIPYEDVTATVSVGHAFMNDLNDDFAGLIRTADALMYEDKKKRRIKENEQEAR